MLPGLALAVLVAAVAGGIARVLPALIGPVLLAVALGLVVANVAKLPPATAPGVAFAARRVLRVGVVLLGARLTFADVAAIGAPTLLVVVLTMSVAFGTVAVASRLAGVPSRLATLLGVGTAVCGNTAIMATAPVVGARDREVSVAVGTITIFGTLALVVFPTIGHLLDLPDEVAGFWIGLAVNDTSQVVAAAAAYSDAALDVAVVVKLVRNALMAPLIALIAWVAAQRRPVDADVGVSARAAFPTFVLGFLALALARSVGLISDEVGTVLGEIAGWLIVVAIAGVGLGTRVGELRQVGLRPVLVGFGAAVALAIVGLGVAWVLGS